ncbi:hypothetical protein OUZ56_031631 [Daphnia magna]|uniref:O-acyltransferase n=1 Tax=Daphnia magna TaxID=35525 RepID=A0ABQ9ZUR5_9CRUS|nr:hypothetical protein OUZ56_031631 [Daphnia magna]
MEAADDKFNASSQEFIRLRKPTTIPSREHIDTIEKRKRMDSPIITTQEDDDNSLENAAVIQQIALTRVKHQAEVLKKELLDQMDIQLSSIMEEYVAGIECVRVPQKYRSFLGDDQSREERKKRKLPCGSLPEKEFIARHSLLTDLFEINHIQTIYHIFIAILILLFMNTVVEDIFDKGRIDLEFALILWAFGDFQTVLVTWVGMMFFTLIVVYPAFHYWSHKRLTIVDKSKRLAWDYFWLACYIVYMGAAIWVPLTEILAHKLPPASATTLLMEQVRLLMKTHAFVRSNVATALSYDNQQYSKPPGTVDIKEDSDQAPCPDFSKYLYFMFAPTLVYRNRYPRTSSIRWKWVFFNFLQVVGVLFYLYFIFVRFCVPVFRQIGHEPMSGKALVLAVFGCMLPGTLVLLCGFFCLLHAWLNAFAEMLRFADRMFYQDWWNSSSYATYYRTWNVVVHDWLYTYVYKDLYEVFGRRNRVIPTLVVFLISSIVHEYIITFTFHCFYPVLLLMFGGFGMLFSFVTNVDPRLGNIFMWLTLFIGTGLCMSLYSMEWYARVNCPPSFEGFMEILIPRSWTCLANGNI